MVPLPLPLRFEVIVIHGSVLVAVHAHPADTVMVTMPAAPSVGTDCDVGESSNRHGAASCDTRRRSPLTAISPSRRDVDGLGAARKANEADPCPVVGETSEIQLTCVETVHAHSGFVATDTEAVPPSAEMAAGVDKVS